MAPPTYNDIHARGWKWSRVTSSAKAVDAPCRLINAVCEHFTNGSIVIHDATGATNAVMTFPIIAGSSPTSNPFGPNGIKFSTAIYVAITGANNEVTLVYAED